MLFPEIDLMVPTGRAALEAVLADCAPNAPAGRTAISTAPSATQAIVGRNALLLFKLQFSIGKSTPPEFFQDDSGEGMGFSP
jgi:hypothetical protein